MKESLIDYWKKEGIINDRKLLSAFRQVPRENFIQAEHLPEAYGDYPLPIGKGQTISQPTTVMIMIDALKLKKTDKVLEIGAGSGYCAAIMSKLAKKVITTEIIPDLVLYARKNLDKTGIKNVEVLEHDGSKGYEKEALYDKIMITAACPDVPKPLINQLKNNGILIAPVGGFFGQKMIRIIKSNNNLKTESLGYFTFVPLKGKFGYKQ